MTQSRYEKTLLGESQQGLNNVLSPKLNAPMVDLSIGGQHAHQSDLRYFHANTDYIRRNVVAKLISAPSGLRCLPSDSEWMAYVELLKGIVEMHAMTWEGLNSTLSVNNEETAVSGAGEIQQTPTQVLRQRSEPSMTLIDKYGLAALRLFEFWQQELIMDPDTQYPAIFSRPNARNLPRDWLPDRYSMTMLFFEPDPTFQFVNRAWLVGNMYPTGGLENTGRRDKTAAGEKASYTIPFTAITQRGLAVNEMAQKFLDEMRISGTSPNLAPTFVEKIAQDVASGRRGYTEQISEASRVYVRP